MRTYDAAAYSDLTQNATLYMIQPAKLDGVMGGNMSSFQVVLDGATYPARTDADGRVRVTVPGKDQDQIVYKVVMAGGRKRSHNRTAKNRNRDHNRDHTRNIDYNWNDEHHRNRNRTRNRDRSRNRDRDRDRNRNSNNGY